MGEYVAWASQRGVALIKAMLVVALATTVAVAMVSRQQFDIRRTGNLLQLGQAGLYTDGVEAWAAQLLRRDREDNAVDHAEEEWATVLPPIPVDGGSVAGSITDLQGRFNLNTLLSGGKIDSKAVERFRRLLTALRDEYPQEGEGINPELAMVMVDWLDTDLETSFPDGAEDDHYLGGERPYRSANGVVVSPSELLLLKGMDHKSYLLLKQHVTALPEGTKINVNTATVPVLMSLAEGVSGADAEALTEARPYEKVDDFLAHDSLAGLGDKIDKEVLTVVSDYFLIDSQVTFGALSQQRYSVLIRDEKGEGRILMRAQGSY
ncbi:MAG: type II secretion system minor pseudopilin GspK [Chromatiales bacterium]|nr:type II secretion system minor pseudopilin GspK [Chromatiales bacterium]